MGLAHEVVVVRTGGNTPRAKGLWVGSAILNGAGAGRSAGINLLTPEVARRHANFGFAERMSAIDLSLG